MLIQVTQEHIDEGCAKICEKCPIALAVRKLLNQTFDLQVLEVGITILDAATGFSVYWLTFPMKVSYFISRFDGQLPVEPFKFNLEIPEKYLC